MWQCLLMSCGCGTRPRGGLSDLRAVLASDRTEHREALPGLLQRSPFSLQSQTPAQSVDWTGSQVYVNANFECPAMSNKKLACGKCMNMGYLTHGWIYSAMFHGWGDPSSPHLGLSLY